MKTLFTFLLSGMFLFLAHTDATACSLSPTAVIDVLPDETVFLQGDPMLFEGYASSANCGYIAGYRWQVDGSTVSTDPEYIPNLSLPAEESSKTFDVQLRVKNSVGKYGYQTVSITIVRSHKSFYYLTDHLGSVRVTVNDAGDAVGWDDYYPFGLQMPGRTQNHFADRETDVKFTGYELEQQGDLNIYHAEARMYDPVIGRFNSVDPITNTRNPQELFEIHNGRLLSYSPYAYTFNNPLRYTDPDGQCPEPANTDGTICVALFIQSESALGLEGDNRDFSSSSDPSQSRLFLHIDVENQTFTIEVNETCTTGGNCADPAPTNQIDVVFGDDGGFSISVDAKNSLRPRSSPAINASFTFTPDGRGGFTTSGNRDAFPSAEAYLWRGGQPTPLFQRSERTPFHLFPWMPKDRWPR